MCRSAKGEASTNTPAPIRAGRIVMELFDADVRGAVGGSLLMQLVDWKRVRGGEGVGVLPGRDRQQGR